MPHFEQPTYGDLYVEYNVVLPVEISAQTRRSEWFYSIPAATDLFVELAEAFRASGSGHDEL